MTAAKGPTEAMRVVRKADMDEIVGWLDDNMAAAIIATGATRDELMEAYGWLTADDALHRAPHGTVARLRELLEAATEQPEGR
jgi:hypothetical protein